MIKRVNRGKGHSYVDTDTGEKIPGVTTYIGDGVPKPALVNWAGNSTAEYAVDHWDELSYVESYVRFLDEHDVQPILVERVVHSAEHNYCGTFDLIANLVDPDEPDPGIWLLDIKTSRSGIFGETSLQLAAYRYAEVWIDEENETEHAMPEVDFTGAVHVRADGYDLVPLEAGPTQHREFLYVMQVAGFVKSARELVGDPIASPYASSYRLVRDDT